MPKGRVKFKSKTKALNAGYKACNCIKEVKYKKRRKKRVVKKVKKVPKIRTIVKTVVKKPKKIYVASKSGKTVHEKICPFAKKIIPKSRVKFKSKTEALNKGYKACSCIKEVKYKKKRKKRIVKKVKKVPKTRTIVKTVVKKPKKIYVVSKGGNTLHIKECPFAKKIGKANKVIVKSKTKAFNAGYKPCACIRKV